MAAVAAASWQPSQNDAVDVVAVENRRFGTIAAISAMARIGFVPELPEVRC